LSLFPPFSEELALTTFVRHDIGCVSKAWFDPIRPLVVQLPTAKGAPLKLKLSRCFTAFPRQKDRKSCVGAKQQYTTLLIFARRINLDYSIHHLSMFCLRNPRLYLRKHVQIDKNMVYSVIFGASRDAKSGPSTAMTNVDPLCRTVLVLELQMGCIPLKMPDQSAIFDQIRLLRVKRQCIFRVNAWIKTIHISK